PPRRSGLDPPPPAFVCPQSGTRSDTAHSPPTTALHCPRRCADTLAESTSTPACTHSPLPPARPPPRAPPPQSSTPACRSASDMSLPVPSGSRLCFLPAVQPLHSLRLLLLVDPLDQLPQLLRCHLAVLPEHPHHVQEQHPQSQHFGQDDFVHRKRRQFRQRQLAPLRQLFQLPVLVLAHLRADGFIAQHGLLQLFHGIHFFSGLDAAGPFSVP